MQLINCLKKPLFKMLPSSRVFRSSWLHASNYMDHVAGCIFCRTYASGKGCRRATADIPPDPPDAICTEPCVRRKKKEHNILHKIKLKVTEGGTNFGTPFWRLRRTEPVVQKESQEPRKALLPPKPAIAIPPPRPGIQVAILGADTAIGQYLALLLKQCSCFKKLRLYEAADNAGCNRNVCQVVEDLQHINTNCNLEAFSCACCDLERCLQNSDIVVILESGYSNIALPYEQRFYNQAPLIKCYADTIANECPKAFIIVCATPIDCMVPLIAETLKETGWYNPCKLIGSLAVPEMRASTLAARALCLEPRYTRVPCVGGTEGESLVPLFSKAVEYFDFARNNALLMTDAVRSAPQAVARQDDDYCVRQADLSEAHAVAGLVTKVAHALLCNDVPRVTAFIETDPRQVISPARYIANKVDLSGTGIIHQIGLPKMTEWEITQVNLAFNELRYKLSLAQDWYWKYCSSTCRLDTCQLQFFMPKYTDRLNDCAYATI